jgi:hypothetical protein
MIIYYHKKSGHIEGCTNGRIHGKEHLQMWIGDPKETERLIIEWKKIVKTKAHGEYMDFYPDHEQAELIIEIEKYPARIHSYHIDVETKKLIPNE